jgi:5-methylthioadenosine/S-adenosylhomocysteine deaminase
LGKFLQSGVAVGLGSDSVASNNTCDILEEARFATLMGRSEFHNQPAEGSFPGPGDALQMATLGGARALGYAEQIGELRVGKQADFVAIALTGTHQIPIYAPVSALIFASSGRDVLMTVVAGKEIYRDGRILTVDEEQLKMRIKEIAIRMRS